MPGRSAVDGLEEGTKMRPGGRSSPAARVAFALRSSVASPERPASPPGFWRGAGLSRSQEPNYLPPGRAQGGAGTRIRKTRKLGSGIDRDITRERRDPLQPLTDRAETLHLETTLGADVGVGVEGDVGDGRPVADQELPPGEVPL